MPVPKHSEKVTHAYSSKSIIKNFIGIFLIVCFLFISYLYFFADKILTVNKPIKCGDLVLEGWIPPIILENFTENYNLQVFRNIYITGVKKKLSINVINKFRDKTKPVEGPLPFYSNGTAYLRSTSFNFLKNKGTFNKVSIYAHGDTAYNISPLVFVAIGDSVIGKFYAGSLLKKYTLHVSISDTILQFFSVYYGNDYKIGGRDRNFYLDSVSFDNYTLIGGNGFNVVYDHKLPAGYANYPFGSEAEFAHAYLNMLGTEAKLNNIDTLYSGRNKTRATAKALEMYFLKNDSSPESFTIVSFGLHSKRSYLTYSNIFPKSEVGVIALHDINYKGIAPFRSRIGAITDEYVSIVGEWMRQ